MKLVITQEEIRKKVESLPLPPNIKIVKLEFVDKDSVEVGVSVKLGLFKIAGEMKVWVAKFDDRTLHIRIGPVRIQGINIAELLTKFMEDLPMLKKNPAIAQAF